MSFVMFAAGSTSRARVRTVSIRSLAFGGALAALSLLVLGAGLGYWFSTSSSTLRADRESPHAALPFTVEQLGALSGRLFRLESQAGQLSERIGVMLGGVKGSGTKERATQAGSGGPMLPPRLDSGAPDELSMLEARLADVAQQIARVSDAATMQNLVLMRLPTRLPVEGADLVSSFGNREDPLTGRRAFHAGLDFAAVPGTPIHAAAGGTVAFAGFRPDYGWVVEVDHGNDLTTRYAHASRLLVKAGEFVTPGDAIATVGSTGRSTGPHLHFEVLRRGEATDPRRYLASR